MVEIEEPVKLQTRPPYINLRYARDSPFKVQCTARVLVKESAPSEFNERSITVIIRDL